MGNKYDIEKYVFTYVGNYILTLPVKNTKNVKLALYFRSNITKDFGFVSVSLCHVVFSISNVNIYTTLNYSLHV